MRTLTELKELQPPAAELSRLNPADDVLGVYRQRLVPALEADVQTALGNRDWDGAQALIDGVAELLPAEGQTRIRNRVTAARSDFDRGIETLVASLNRAASEGRMDVARKAYDDLRQTGADEATVQGARNSVLGGYISAVNRQAAAGDFPAANDTLTAGLAFDPSSTRLTELRDTITQQRESAERVGREEAVAQQLARAQELRTSLAAALAQPNMDIRTAERAVADADKLALVAADDPLAGRNGHEQIGRVLADQALAMGARSQWDPAVKLLDEARGLIGASPSLEAARADVLRARDADRARQSDQRFAEQQQRLDALIASPRYDAAWVTEVRNSLDAVRRALPENDARLASVGAAQQRAGELLLARAREMRDAKRFDEADRLLRGARDFAAGMPALATEQQALAAARQEAERAREREVAAAGVAQNKNNFEKSVAANEVGPALTTLDELRKQLQATDPYLTTTAPQQLAGAYARLAEDPFNQKDYAQAQRLVDEGLKFWSSSPALQKLAADIRTAREPAAPPPPPPPPRQEPVVVETKPVELPPVAPPREPQEAPPPARKAPPCIADFAGLGGRGGSARCADFLSGETRGPTLVVIPAGGGVPAAFAIGRTEVSVGQWGEYCRLSRNCAQLPDNPDFPVTNIDAAAIEGYAAWLTQRTGVAYRLPTTEEWLQAVNGPRTAQTSFNCIDGQGRGNQVRDVNGDAGNEWGVRDYFGNVRELVKTGGGYELRGGSYRDRLNLCTAQRVESYSQPDAATGFRLVRALGEQK
jgi:hypothetical protein